MKPSIPKGTRDFSPEQVFKRKYIFDIIRGVFEKYGFQPIETPSMENLVTLTGKYGEEGDALLFKVLNNGDFLAKADEKALEEKNSSKLVASISKRGLRYDLTVPFARYVVMHQNDIAFPFKRYQIQPVWRADRPQKGRYQEFYQCDVDVIGSDSLIYEAELAQIYDEVFTQLGINVDIRLNNRKILAGLAEVAGISEQLTTMTVAIDKLDKIGMDGVKQEMAKRNIPESAINTISKLLAIKSLDELEPAFGATEIGKRGIQELRTCFRYLATGTVNNSVFFDITLARGLNYYTGCIYEVNSKDVKMGSIGGGGRYDDLTGVFGLKNVSGVGISFGAERIFDVMETLDLFPDQEQNNIQVLFMALDNQTLEYAFKNLVKARKLGIKADLYPDVAKLKKQMKYANARKVAYVALIGTEELEQEKITLKNMQTGDQESVTFPKLIEILSSNTRKITNPVEDQ